MATTRTGPHASPGYHLWHAGLRWTGEIARALQPVGITHTQFFLLGALKWVTRSSGRAPKQREVADFAHLDRVTTSQVVRTLVASGLIVRADDPDDSRAWLLRLTPRGETAFQQAVARVREVDQRFFRSLGRRLPDFLEELAALHEPPPAGDD